VTGLAARLSTGPGAAATQAVTSSSAQLPPSTAAAHSARTTGNGGTHPERVARVARVAAKQAVGRPPAATFSATAQAADVCGGAVVGADRDAATTGRAVWCL
jgi:hypothetical protein